MGPSKIGILGGAFDPIHVGHVAAARAAIAAEKLDLVLVVPCARAPHKSDFETSAEHRLAMVRLAVESEVKMEACDLELRRGGVSYTADTVSEIAAGYLSPDRRRPERLSPDSDIGTDIRLFLILGQDAASGLPSWRDASRILDQVEVLVVPRLDEGDSPDCPADETRRASSTASSTESSTHSARASSPIGKLIPMETVNVASRTVRDALREGRVPNGLVTPSVADYIRTHGLYDIDDTQTNPSDGTRQS